MPKELIQLWCKEVPETYLRNETNYEEDVALNDFKKTGIHCRCPFNVLKAYHCILNGVVDKMHDVEEGLIRYILCFLMKYYESIGKFSYELRHVSF